MSEVKGGGPAFPTTQYANGISPTGHDFGMTMRDYFAAKAMQGMCATLGEVNGEPFWTVLASDAYKIADAMLRAREEK